VIGRDRDPQARGSFYDSRITNRWNKKMLGPECPRAIENSLFLTDNLDFRILWASDLAQFSVQRLGTKRLQLLPGKVRS
jgi:hypothetical protein